MSGYTEIALLQYELEKLRARVAELEKELSEVRKADGESAAREIRAMGDE